MGKRRQLGKNDLAILFFVTIFMNGYETGGYQAALMEIGAGFGMNEGQQGLLAAVELFATMIAPLVLGGVADRVGKKKMLVAFTAARVLSSVIMLLCREPVGFGVGIFIMGFATSILQYVAIAGMEDAYPLTNKRRMGSITAMYAAGAVSAPYVVGLSLRSGGSWKLVLVIDLIISLAQAVLFWLISFAPREQAPALQEGPAAAAGRIYAVGVFWLCFIMFVYVGVENGVGFFLNAYMHDAIGVDNGYIALSLFWLTMIPSRILCGIFERHRRRLIVAAPLGAAALLAVLAVQRFVLPSFFFAAVLGFFCGAVYPNVLTYAYDFSAGKTATVVGLITFATGVGGTLLSAFFGFWLTDFGVLGSFLILAGLMLVDTAAALWISRTTRS